MDAELSPESIPQQDRAIHQRLRASDDRSHLLRGALTAAESAHRQQQFDAILLKVRANVFEMLFIFVFVEQSWASGLSCGAPRR